MTEANKPEVILPGDWLGMIGGGQLGRMFCHAAQSMGYRVAVLDPDEGSPAGAVADMHICTPFDDRTGLEKLAVRCPAVSTEFENVPADTLAWLAHRVHVRPGADAVVVTQDRAREKMFFTAQSAPVVPYAEIRSATDIAGTPDGLYPGILKTARFGYDGRGQVRVANREQAAVAFEQLGGVDCVLEAMLDLEREVSVVLVRDHIGEIVCYPPVQNVHSDGILAFSFSGALEDRPELAGQAVEIARSIAAALNYVGVLCVEFFVLRDGRLVVNEMAPRPHNSGHYTMDACVSSQFEQQVRVLAGLPVGSIDSRGAAVMINILGDIWFEPGSDQRREPAWEQVLAVPGAHLHLYGKAAVRRGRKMGHVNVVATDVAQARDKARKVAELLHIPFTA